MEIEARWLMELAVHVKLASEAVLEAARNLARVEPSADDVAAWRRATDELLVMNMQLTFMERLLRTAAASESVVVSVALPTG